MATWKKQEFELLLRESYKLTPTTEGIPSARAWQCPGGQHVLVPTLKSGELYDDAILARIVRALNAVSQNPLQKQRAASKAPKKKK